MDMNLPGNSDKDRALVEKKAPVANGKLQKQSFGNKLLSSFIVSDSRDLKKVVVDELIKPKIAELMYDVVCETVGTLLGVRVSRNRKTNGTPQASYQKFWDDGNSLRQANPVRNTSSTNDFDYQNVLFDTRSDAEMVIDRLNEQLASYGRVSVLDYYDFSNVTVNNPQLANYGWRDISGTRAMAVSGGYIITLPRAINIR